jgi:hypothetical protein
MKRIIAIVLYPASCVGEMESVLSSSREDIKMHGVESALLSLQIIIEVASFNITKLLIKLDYLITKMK